MIMRKVPITSLEVLKETRAKITRTNRRRSSEMERRIAKYLQGDKTPQSGSGLTKADCIIPLVNHPGRYLVECKLSSQKRKGVMPMIRLEYEWLSTLKKHVFAMKSRFGILIIHFMHRGTDYVFINLEDIPLLDTLSDSHMFTRLLKTEVYTYTDKERITITLYHDELTKMLDAGEKRTAYQSAILIMHIGSYLCIPLTLFKTLLRNEEGIICQSGKKNLKNTKTRSSR